MTAPAFRTVVPRPRLPVDPPVGHPRARGGSARGRHTIPRRVRDMIAASVRGGYYAADRRLAEDALMAELGASRNAVRHALRSLADDGVLARLPGRGTVVQYRGVRLTLADFAPIGPATGVGIRITDQRVEVPTALLRDRLRIDARVPVRMVENVFEDHSGLEPVVLGVRTAYFRDDAVVGPFVDSGRLDDVIRQTFGRRVGSVRTELGAERAEARTSRMLGIDLGAPVLVREQLVLDVAGEPVEVVFDHFRADRVTFVDGP